MWHLSGEAETTRRQRAPGPPPLWLGSEPLLPCGRPLTSTQWRQRMKTRPWLMGRRATVPAQGTSPTSGPWPRKAGETVRPSARRAEVPTGLVGPCRTRALLLLTLVWPHPQQMACLAGTAPPATGCARVASCRLLHLLLLLPCLQETLPWVTIMHWPFPGTTRARHPQCSGLNCGRGQRCSHSHCRR